MAKTSDTKKGRGKGDGPKKGDSTVAVDKGGDDTAVAGAARADAKKAPGKRTSPKTSSSKKSPGKKASGKADRKAAEKQARKEAEKVAKAERKAAKKAQEAVELLASAETASAKAAKAAAKVTTAVEAAETVDATDTRAAATLLDPADIAAALRVDDGFRLAETATGDTPGADGLEDSAELLMRLAAEEIDRLQQALAASAAGGEGRSVLLVLQGPDTAGKGAVMRDVVAAIHPHGVRATAFGVPSAEEKRRPFLWRIRRALPGAGLVGVFDRSHYEDVLVARVDDLVPVSTWRRRYGQIRQFERSLAAGGTTVVKVMLHLGADEQQSRVEARRSSTAQVWRDEETDRARREQREAYQEAYAEALAKTSIDEAPWYVVPADRQWYARLAVQQLLLGALRDAVAQAPRR